MSSPAAGDKLASGLDSWHLIAVSRSSGVSLALAMTMALAVGGASCVLPIGPEFEPEGNLPPFALQAEPAVGSFVRDPETVFRVTVEDPNRLDNLHLLWLIDYPPFEANITGGGRPTTLAARGPDQLNRHDINMQPSCIFDRITRSLTEHRLVLVVSDRPFLDQGGGNLVEPAPGSRTLWLAWTFERVCQ